MSITTSIIINKRVTKELSKKINTQILTTGLKVVNLPEHELILGTPVERENVLGKITSVIPNNSKTLAIASLNTHLKKVNFTLYESDKYGFIVCLE